MKITKQCKWCENKFHVITAKQKQQYCSKTCYRAAAAAHNTDYWCERICETCNKIFSCRKLYIEQNNTHGRYCSRKCACVGHRHKTIVGSLKCHICGIQKDMSNFTLTGTYVDGSPKYDSRCHACQNARKTSAQQDLHVRFATALRKACSRNKVWQLSFDEWACQIMKPCHYCGGSLGIGVGLDRKNNDIGYILTNTVPCCGTCNWVKSDIFTYDEMLQLATTLRQIRLARQS